MLTNVLLPASYCPRDLISRICHTGETAINRGLAKRLEQMAKERERRERARRARAKARRRPEAGAEGRPDRLAETIRQLREDEGFARRGPAAGGRRATAMRVATERP